MSSGFAVDPGVLLVADDRLTLVRFDDAALSQSRLTGQNMDV